MDIQDRASEQIALGEKYPSELHYTDDNRYEAALTTSLSWQGIAALSVVYRFTRTWKLTIWDVANPIATFQSVISLGGANIRRGVIPPRMARRVVRLFPKNV